jgi:hypothetical protein
MTLTAHASRPPSAYFMGSLGISMQGQPGLRDWFDTEHAYISPVLPGWEWKSRFDPGVTPSAEIGIPIGSSWTAAVSAEGFSSRIKNLAYGGPYSWNGWADRMEVRFLDVSLHAVWWPEELRGGYLGAKIGRGRGHVQLSGGGRLTADPNDQVLLNGVWDQTAMTCGAYAGWRSSWLENPLVDVRVGWNGRDQGLVDTDSWQGPFGSASGPLRDYEGRPVRTDFSGPFASVGLVFALGRTP